MRKQRVASLTIAALVACNNPGSTPKPEATASGPASAPAASSATGGPNPNGAAAAQKWIDAEFQPSTLSKQAQTTEMDFFIKAAAPFRGMEVNVLSETIPTH